jgi:nucleotide-binding universal stress UspA family protein
MYDTILVPTDGSEHARRAAEHAVTLARAFDATVHVIAVADVQAAAGPFSAGGVSEDYVERLEDDRADAIAAVEEVADERGLTAIETAVIRGKPTESILEYVEEEGVDLVAMGTHGRTGVERYIAGSVTEHVVRFAEVPVLTARVTERSAVTDGYDDILLPTDGSEYAAVAYDHGIAIADAFDARIHAVNVVDVSDLTASPETVATESIAEGLEAAGEAATEDIAARARDDGIETVTAVRQGTPAQSLLAYAEDAAVDLIAMGTAGRTGPSRYLLGSTTERTVRHADVPVLAVDARDLDE